MGMAYKSKITVGHEKLNCGMEMDKMSHEESEAQKHCCDDEYESLEVVDDYQSTNFDFAINSQFTAAFLYTFFNFNEEKDTEEIVFKDYTPPPLLNEESLILFQTFLI